jgi:ClpP class serine protease
MTDLPTVPLTLSLTGRPLLLWPNVVPELSARLTDAHRARAERRTAWIGDRAARLSAKLKSKLTKADATPPSASASRFDDDLLAPNSIQFVSEEDVATFLAVIEIEGPLLDQAWVMLNGAGEQVTCFDGYDRIEQATLRALNNPNCAGVLLSIDSPGGMVNGCFECVDALYAAAATAGKPLHTHTSGLLASAAYALASAGTRVSATLSATVGSIGVIYGRVDQTAHLADEGIKIDLITSGERKSWGYMETEASDEELAHHQAEIDHLATHFFTRVARTRPLDVDGVIALQAGPFLGEAAVSAGLSDAVESRADALKALAAAAAPTAPETTSSDSNPSATSPDPVPAAQMSSTDGPTQKERSMKSTLKMRAALTASLSTIALAMATNHAAAKDFDDDQKAALTAAIQAETDETVDAMDDDDVETMTDEDTDAMENDDDVEALDESEMDEDEIDAADRDDPDAEGEDPEAENDDDDAPMATKVAASKIVYAAFARLKSDQTAQAAQSGDPAAVAQAILALPEAKGFEAIANKLAFSGATVDGARATLKAAADATRKAKADARPIPSPKVGAGGKTGAKSPAESPLLNAVVKRNKAQARR